MEKVITKFILLRHGETDANKSHLLQGWFDMYGLNANGRAQASYAAEYLKDFHIDVAYCSDLIRAVETAEIALSYHPNVVLNRTRELREWNCGIYDGTDQNLLAKDHPEVLKVFSSEKGNLPMPDGEDRMGFQKRIEDFFDRTALENIGKTVLICTHGGTMQRIFRMAAGAVNEKNRLPLPVNASVGIIKYLHGWGGWQLDQWNIHHYIPEGTIVNTLVM
ncbi:MAG: histidine phosphatase family protein [Victivallales bacterium]|nr:histidine phosphatase family protein [Victivallales bacterium]